MANLTVYAEETQGKINEVETTPIFNNLVGTSSHLHF